MTYSTAARRLAWRRIGAVVTAVISSLVVVSNASAAVQQISPDGSGATTDNLGHAMQTAASSGGNQTIILQPGLYIPQELQPGYGLPPVVSGENLTIVVAHNTQASNGNSGTVNGNQADQASHPADLFTVQSGGTLTLEGVAVTGANPSDSGHSGIRVLSNGTLTLYGDLIAGEQGLAALNVESGGTATVNETTFNASSGADAVQAAGTLTLNNDDIANTLPNGTGLSFSGTVTANNTVLFNNGTDCSANVPNQDTVVADDGTCSGTAQTVNSASLTNHGGPTQSFIIPGIPAGDPLVCPSTDQRFFVIPKSSGSPQCSAGATTSTAQLAIASGTPTSTQVVDAPACAAQPANYSTNPATMTVWASDTGSGLGPEAGGPADSTTGSVLTGTGANNPANTANVNPADAVSNAETTDGSIALLNPFTSPTWANPPVPTSGTPEAGQLQVEATKSAGAHSSGDTSWAFDTTNWAGITVECH